MQVLIWITHALIWAGGIGVGLGFVRVAQTNSTTWLAIAIGGIFVGGAGVVLRAVENDLSRREYAANRDDVGSGQ